jgi:hypothetical protein
METKKRMREIWNSDNWKEQRVRLINEAGGTCQWPNCGETKDLVIHHLKPIKTISKNDVAYHLFIKSEEYMNIPIIKEKVKLCPKCNSKNIRFRSRAKNFICNRCQFIFEEPAIIDIELLDRNKFTTEYHKFKEKYDDEITKRYNDENEKRWNEYTKDLVLNKDAKVLCKKHHFCVEKGLKPCSKCGSPYKPNGFSTLCYNCKKKEGILEKCPICNKNYFYPYNPFNPSERIHDRCKECEFMAQVKKNKKKC